MRTFGYALAYITAALSMAYGQVPSLPTGTPPTPGNANPIATPGTGVTVPAVPVTQPPVVSAPVLTPATPSDPRLMQHLKGWEDALRNIVNFRADFETTRTEATFGKTTDYTGSVLCMKPNLARLRLVEKNKPANYEAFICSGNAIFHYDGVRKTMTQHLLNPAVANSDNLMLDFLSGMKAADALARFDITLPKDPDQYYVYFLIKPKLAKDRQEFEEVRFAIYGPNLPPTHKHLSYLPAQVFVKKPNGDTELWRFKDLQTNLVGIDAKVFQYEPPPKDWTIQQAPPQAIPNPGVTPNPSSRK